MIVLELFDAGAIHLRCTADDCPWEQRIDPEFPETEHWPASVDLDTVAAAAQAHNCGEPPEQSFGAERRAAAKELDRASAAVAESRAALASAARSLRAAAGALQ